MDISTEEISDRVKAAVAAVVVGIDEWTNVIMPEMDTWKPGEQGLIDRANYMTMVAGTAITMFGGLLRVIAVDVDEDEDRPPTEEEIKTLLEVFWKMFDE